MDAEEIVLDLFYGRWRSQTLHAGVELGLFDATGREPGPPAEIARRLGLDPARTHRLMRALAAMRLMHESDDGTFTIAPAGAYLCSDHPQSMRHAVLLREGPEHTAIWKHLPQLVRDGHQNAFVREFGMKAFDYAAHEVTYGNAFNAGMSSQSSLQTAWALEAFEQIDLSSVRTLCDVGGGQGHLLCHMLRRYRHVDGVILERAGVAEAANAPWARDLGVADRCRVVAGDMFVDAPVADAYTLKLILHDWNDDECVRILETLRRRASNGGRVFIIEHVIRSDAGSDQAALFDMHMMCWGDGCERTEQEYARLLTASGWRHLATRYPLRGAMGIVEGEGQKG